MQTRDEVECLHNCREFSQRLECLYQAKQTQEKSFLLLLRNNFPEKKRKTFCMALIKREILTSRKVLSTGILYFADWTGLDWTRKTRTCKTRTQNL